MSGDYLPGVAGCLPRSGRHLGAGMDASWYPRQAQSWALTEERNVQIARIGGNMVSTRWSQAALSARTINAYTASGSYQILRAGGSTRRVRSAGIDPASSQVCYDIEPFLISKPANRRSFYTNLKTSIVKTIPRFILIEWSVSGDKPLTVRYGGADVVNPAISGGDARRWRGPA